MAETTAEERKRKRLEAWRKRQAEQQKPKPKPKTKFSLGKASLGSNKKAKKSNKAPSLVFEEGSDDETGQRRGDKLSNLVRLDEQSIDESSGSGYVGKTGTKKRGRWDASSAGISAASKTTTTAHRGDDALDEFMQGLKSKENVPTQAIELGRVPENEQNISSQVMSAEELLKQKPVQEESLAGEAEKMNEEEEEEARRSFIEALKSTKILTAATDSSQSGANNSAGKAIELASEVKTERQRRELQLKQLTAEAEAARKMSSNSTLNPNGTGRLFSDEGAVMEESERMLAVLTAAPDALEVLAELNKKKELRGVNHDKIDYIHVKKNLYLVPRAIAALSKDEVDIRRAELKIKVRGAQCPAPISLFEETGLTERILSILSNQNITTPYPIQAQCLPAIMAGRDVIGIAKTGSGKTLAYLLPMLRHIIAQPDLEVNESGPIGIVLAPARELAVQIHSVCKVFAKKLNLRSTAVYGGAGVAEQIGDLKRGCHIVVATPGRMIDILTMQSGKLLSFNRVSYVVLDEADRMFDMGFSPQISSIIGAIRPDRQTVLFSATFPKSVEALARKSLSYPIEVIVGGRSVASDSVTQYGEVIEEGDKFLRLLQLLGEHVDEDTKCIVFVDTQVRADAVFEQLMRSGYSSLSLHGGKEQEDRDSTISDFKKKNGPGVLVATSVAGRGLDVPSCGCVINYSAPSHLEDYVHRVGRTGRAGSKGVSYTFCNSTEEEKYAPFVVKAMIEAGQGKHIADNLKALSDSFKAKVKKGDARWAGSGFQGKGYSYDASELSDAQKLARLEKRQALIEAGLADPDEEEPVTMNGSASREDDLTLGIGKKSVGNDKTSDLGDVSGGDKKLTAGMQDAIMRKLGLATAVTINGSGNHFVEDIDINDYPREARWKVTQKDTVIRLQDDYQCAVTLKGEYFGPGRIPGEGESKLHLHIEATTQPNLMKCVHEVRRLLNEETLRVGARNPGSGRYNVLG